MKPLTAIIASTAVASMGFLAVAPAAQAAQASQTPGQVQVIKTIPTVAVNATTPGTLVVAGHRGLPVTVWTKGTKAQTKRPTTSTKAVAFNGLLPARKYDVYVGETKSVSVFTAKSTTQSTNKPAANSLTANPGQLDNSMALAWNITLPKGVAASKVKYTITAAHAGASPMQLTRTGASQATLTDLDPSGRYAFTVVAKLPDGSTRTAKATMSDTVAGAHARKASTAVTPAVATEPAKATTADSGKASTSNATQTSSTAGSNSAPAPAPAPNPTPAPAPKPEPGKTKIIYVCPTGYTEVGDLCQTTRDYTYTTETRTAPYTYRTEVTKMPYTYTTIPETTPYTYTGGVKNPAPSGWTDNGTEYTRTIQEKNGAPAGFNDDGTQWVRSIEVKNAAPEGWTDDGTQYVKTDRIKDGAPAGYTDNGTQWVKTVAKVAKEVPA